MNPEQHDESEIQRMLALKRHEQPPAEFFQGFSGRVIDRLHAAGPAPKLTLRQRLSLEFYGVPIYVCLAGILVCGLLVAGLIVAMRVPASRSVADTTKHPLAPEAPSHTLVPPAAPSRLGGDTTVTIPESGGSSGAATRATMVPPPASGQGNP